ncbi:MAG: hypothetical protein A3F54_04605 [Candidatus Kerfeldbacteria bacterium RIFCSPHIGHO2_12_FULL_48_17]|uniref:FAD dependent oxidoreductase domain-containing protein n=1 Tax=Candidatus Kerfeldbacteria bacterium RIFCSPHIGHO2_12_FULL_48_17 TaxID=1798542 RepID=A0A1G2B2J2_9BACT|nr:MAG: hypothetical protein A3F54_04605 [Candidatus Kerfeldbacteria bacterium RIFCSPHIGHO2_12_FULL_48_17]
MKSKARTPIPRVAVIGAGVTGALIANELSKLREKNSIGEEAPPRYDVTVIEQGAIGNGSSSRSAACIRQQFSTQATVHGMMYSVEYYKNFAKHVGKKPSEANVLVQNGYLFLYRDPQRFQEAATTAVMQQQWGLKDVEVLGPPEIRKKFPFVNTLELTGATWCPSDGFLRPVDIYSEALENAVRNGAKLMRNTQVNGATKRGNLITALKTTRGNVPCDIVVNATNAWAPRVSQMLEGTGLPIMSLKRFLWFLNTNHAPGVMEFPMIVAEGGQYFRPENSHQVMLGHAVDITPEPRFSNEDQDVVPWEYDLENADGLGMQTWMELTSWVPVLEKFGKEKHGTTSGFYGTTPDHNPFIDYDPYVPNLIHACGFSGHGIMHAPFTMKIVCALVEKGTRQWTMELNGKILDISIFAVDRNFDNHAEAMVI